MVCAMKFRTIGGLIAVAVLSLSQAAWAANYFVNDRVTNGDVYCSVAGNDTNTGESSSSPMLTLTNLLFAKTLLPGDTVYVDTGIYSNYTVVVDSSDAGSGGSYVTFVGSTNYVAGGTIFRRSNTVTAAFTLLSAPYIRITDMTFEQGWVGLEVRGSPNGDFSKLSCRSNMSYGIFVINSSHNASFSQCVCAYNGLVNNDFNMRSYSSTNVSFQNCVFWGRGQGVLVDGAAAIKLSNSIIRASGLGSVAIRNEGNIASDYNVYFVESNSTMTETESDLYDYQSRFSTDRHSSSFDPLLANPEAFDFHPKSRYGRYQPGSGIVTDLVTSSAIDMGCPSAAYSNEPPENGSRLNVGLYGNTSEASRSPTNAALKALTLNNGGTVSGVVTVYWAAVNFTNGSQVNVEYSFDDGVNWNTLATNVPATNESVQWNTTLGQSSPGSRWRVISQSNTNTWDQTDTRFSVRNATNFNFYVNDTSTSNDVYCSVIGASTNTGLSPASPKLNVTEVLDSFDLNGGDTILMDTGSYPQSNEVLITLFDVSSTNHLTIQGSTNYAGGGTTLINTNVSLSVVRMNGAPRVHLRDLSLVGGYHGVLSRSSPYTWLSRVVTRDNFGNGFFIGLPGSHNSLVENCILINSREYAIWVYSSTNVLIKNTVCWANKGVQVDAGSLVTLRNNILHASGSGYYAVKDGGSLVSADYDIYVVSNGAKTGLSGAIPLATLSDFQKFYNFEWHGLATDPLFANSAGADFHLKSAEGRWNGAAFTNDGVFSPAIDLGDPSMTYTNELSPNGSRINVGAYGDTSEASKSRTNAWLQVLTLNDGGILNVPGDTVYWTAGNLSGGATVRIELSRDSGASWEIVETNILASTGMYTWANTNYDSSWFARWRVVCESNTNVYSFTATNCTYHASRFSYYVNDSSSYGDIYCTALGNDANLGSSRGSPKASLKSVLDDHDLEPGDIVYIDTGYYRWLFTPVVGVLDSGSTNQSVHIQGSTNEVFGGTRIDGFFLNIGIDINGGQYVDLRNVAVTNAGTGIRLNGSAGSRLYQVVARNNRGDGIILSGSDKAEIQRCVSAENASNGVWVSSGTVLLENSVLWRNGGPGVRADSGQINVSNSIVVASGNRSYGYYAAGTGNIVGDYNDLYTESNSVMGYIASLGRNVDTLSAWSWETLCESHSLGVDPLFADPCNGDFHLRTETSEGRFEPGVGWVLDTETSLLIDSGNPSSAFTNEPALNGNRINIGLHGNYPEASKSRAGGWLLAASLSQGGWVKGTSILHWVVGGVATGHNVHVEYSPDGGVSWSRLTAGGGVPSTNEIYAWNTTKTNDTPAGLWRVVSTNDVSITDCITNFFAVRNGPLSFYINDAATLGDIYTAAAGSPTNWLASTNGPLDSLATALAIYDIEPGDVVYVDTGAYTNTANPRMSRLDGGSSSTVVRITGSTNESFSGSVLYRNSWGAEDYGLHLDAAGWVAISNLCLRSARTGLKVNNASSLSFGSVQVLGNTSHGVEISSSSNVVFSRVVSADNGLNGVQSRDSQAIAWQYSILWSNRQGAVTATAGNLAVSNSVLQAFGSGRYLYELISNAVIRADYNAVVVDDQANVANDGGAVSKTLIRWQQSRTNDLHSLSQNPLFADASNGDYHLLSQAGRYSVAVTNFVVTDTNTSTLIDSGDPLAAYSGEQTPNGGRVNIGLHGNDYQASKSRTNGWLLALTLSDGGNVRGTNNLYWVAGGSATGQLVYIDFSADGGVTWSNIATNVSANAGVVLWNTAAYRSTSHGRWRVVSQGDSSIYDETDSFFALNNGSLSYYVNDASTNGDVYCSTIGDGGHDGLSEDSPVLSIQDVLDRYDLMPGDRILVDTGTYPTTNNVFIGSEVSGVATNRLVIQGSTNWASGGTIFDRQNGDRCILLECTEGVELRNLNIVNALTGIRMLQSTNCLLENVRIHGGQKSFELDQCVNTRLEHCAAIGASTNGLLNLASSGTVWQSGVLWSNGWSNGVSVRLAVPLGAYTLRGSVAVYDSVISAFGSNSYAYGIEYGVLTADYNDLYLKDGAYAASCPGRSFTLVYDSVSRWSYDSGQDIHSLALDPKFFDAPNGDFHLMSRTGRYSTAMGTFVADTETSPLVDAGTPTATYTNELLPNGARLNIGLYGNTTEASKSPTNAVLQIITLNDGGRFEGTNYLYWVAQGSATGQRVTLKYSSDNGVTWTNIATNQLASSGSYLWDSTKNPSSLFGRWTISSEQDASVSDQSDSAFALRNTPFRFFVNDASTTGDVYCSAVGSPANMGLSAATPKDTLQGILDAWDLEPGDTVYVDTGTYTNFGTTSIGQFDSGSVTGTARVVIQGSTNSAVGGSAIVGSGSSLGLEIYGASSIELRNLAFRSMSTAVRVKRSHNCALEWITVDGGAVGFNLDTALDTSFQHCLARNATAAGLLNESSSNTIWQSGVLWSNASAVHLRYSTNFVGNYVNRVKISNSVVVVYGSGGYAYKVDFGTVDADYNGIYLVNGAYAATIPPTNSPFVLAPFVPVVFASVSRWARDTGRDGHSFSADPGFADPGGGDFHLKSQVGRYVTASRTYVTDTVSSVLIDGGNPAWPCALEPLPNGGRLNIGYYGNSGEESKTPTNSNLAVLSLNDGGRAEGTNWVLSWVARGDVLTQTVKLDYSPDAGSTWTNIVAGIAAINGQYIWDTTAYTASVRALWRIVGEGDTNVSDVSDQPFALRNGSFTFFVNDASTNGDIYCTDIGSTANLGLLPSAPKDSIESILNTWDLESGDIVFVDTGAYSSNAPITIGQLDAAGISNQVRMVVQGSTNYAAGGTMIDRRSVANGVEILQSGGVEIRDLRIRNALSGIKLKDSDFGVIEWVDVDGGTTGFEVDRSSDIRISHCTAREAASAGLSVNDGESKHVDWQSGVLWSNQYGVYLQNVHMTFSNSVIGVFGEDRYAYYLRDKNSECASDYNNLFLNDGAYAFCRLADPQPIICQNLSRLSHDFGMDRHSLSVDPRFYNSSQGDFHLLSTTGRYDMATRSFVSDMETSPLIDAGSPLAAWTNEPAPNGGRLNVGLYGNNWQESKTPSNAALAVLSLNDGGRVEGTWPLYWVAYGAATGHSVRLEYSADAGVTWVGIATNVAASGGLYMWNTRSYPSSICGVWRVTSENDTNVYGQNDAMFAVRNEPLSFFVNDGITNGDVYCSAVGDAGNSGVLPSSPKDTVQGVLDEWDLEPGDNIYVDTGSYLLLDTIHITRFDAWDQSTNLVVLQTGLATNRMLIQGSTNESEGGTLFTKLGGGDAVWLDESPGVMLRHLVIRNADSGVLAHKSPYSMAEWVRCENGVIGFEVDQSALFRMNHCVARGNAEKGVSAYMADGAEWRNGILWSNTFGAYQYGGSTKQGSLAIANSILGAFSSDSYAYFWVSGGYTSDYNDVYLHGDAFAGGTMASEQLSGPTTRYENVYFWARGTGKDKHTLSYDPGFANLGIGDFHLKTTQPSGRYDPYLRVWTNDAEFSKLIDSGDPLSVYTNELPPNGSRVNIGLYGNSGEASKTPTGGWFSAITLNDGGSVKGTVTLNWLAGGSAIGHLVYLDFSPVGGLTWTNIASNILASAVNTIEWDTSTFGRSAAGLWRIVSCTDSNLYDVSDKFLTMRDNSGSIPYFVNDAYTNGDVYCTVPGVSTNLGLVPSAPADSIQTIIDTFKLEPVDIIYVDTGYYPLTADIVINDLDSGNATNHVSIQGSTNDAAGGSVLNRQVVGGGTHVIVLKDASGIELHDLILSTAENGIRVKRSTDCFIDGVRAEGNGIAGFVAEESSRINFSHCVSWGNGTTNGSGLYLDRSSVIWSNGTIWGNATAVRFAEAGTNRFVNSAFDASGPGQRIFLFDQLTPARLLISDYNNLLPKNEALIAEQEVDLGGNEIYGRLIDWQRGFTQDVHSLSHEPLFANEASGDFRLQSQGGRFLPQGGMTNDAVTSPMIDVGNPSTSYTNELEPNGARVNIGNYGDARAASLSLTNPWLLALTLNDGGSIRGTNTIHWAYGAMTNDSRVRLEFTRNNGVEWFSIASNLLASTTGYSWDVSSELPSAFCRWRVISESATNVYDEVDTVFGIKNQPLMIFVNDTNTLGDVYCSAPGNPANSGLASNAPLNDPSAAIRKYYELISADDAVFIDTGYYVLTNSIEFGETTFGLSGHVVRVRGSTNSAYGGTLIHRNDPSGIGLKLGGTRWIDVDHIRLTGAGTGVQISDSGDCSLEWVECFSNAVDAFFVYRSDLIRFDRCLAWKNAGWGFSASGMSDLQWDHGVLWTNLSGGINLGQSTVLSVSNSILHASRPGSYVYQVSQARIGGDYNVLLAQGAALLGRDVYNGATYVQLQEWQKTINMDMRSGLFDPLFADPGAGNFHLRSEAGRYMSGGWISDTNTSWAIDAGNPSELYANETVPNGSRLNAGLYGNTFEASRSLTNAPQKAFLVASLNDGGLVQGSKLLYWLSRAMSPTDTVRIEYSGNGGALWVVLASNVSATTAGYTWDPSELVSSPLARWRVMLESDPSVADTNDASFILRNGPMIFYVNDSSTLGDVYTSAIGSQSNDGLTTNTPKSRIQDILAYDLEGGDRVLVDTGSYPLTNDIFIGIGDGGVNTALVSIVGSTNWVYGGSIVRGQHTNFFESAGFHFRNASYVEINHFTVQNCDWGLFFELYSANNVISNLLVRDTGSAGIRLAQSSNNRFSRTVVTRTAGSGILSSDSSILFDQCVIWSNQASALNAIQSTLAISNSVLSAVGEGHYCYGLVSNVTIRSDYNDLFISGGANYGLVRGVPMEGIPQWTAVTTQDVHSLGVDPLFYNPAADDYHLRSRTGRYNPSSGAFVTTDTNLSPLIDAGSPSSPWTNEPSPNGSRINIGLYGDTVQASKSSTNEWLMALTASSGGRLEGRFYLAWNAGGLSPTNTVSLDYSFDNATSWTSIVLNVGITNGQYLWNSAVTNVDGGESWPSSPMGRWRVQVDSNTNVYDITDSRFALRNRLFTYYLNDSVTNGDIYTTAVGSDTNLGFYPWSPMATLKALLDVNDIEGEDIIKIDTGVYPITTNDFAVLGPADQGKAGFPVDIMGNTNALVSTFDRATSGLPATILDVNGSYVNLQNLQFLGGHMTVQGGNTILRNVSITNGNLGLSGPTQSAEDICVDGGSVNANGNLVTLNRIAIKDGGFNLSGTNITVQNSLVYGSNGPAVTVNGTAIALRNNTFAGSNTQFRQTGFGGSTLENNIIVADGINNYCILLEGGTLNSDYNNLLARNGAWIGNQNGSWEKLLYWQRASGRDLHSISAEPAFADEAARDYHLKSVVGRWTTSGWTTDAVHSVCIDAGNPLTVLTNELSPHGSRVNLGAFGNTVQASKSQTNAWLIAGTMNDGGVLKGTNAIGWRYGNLGTTDLVQIDYSPDNGGSWTNIAANLSAQAQSYTWNSTLFTSSLQALWRIVLQTNTLIFDQVDTNFAVRNVPLNFYVNDASTNGDVYCSIQGTAGGTGLTPGSPKLTVQEILTSYDTEAGDTIFVDTGVYNLSSDIQVIWSRGGDDSYGNVFIRGSTNFAAGGSQIARNSFIMDADGFDVKASYVTLRDFTVKNGYRGIYLESNLYCSAERVLVVSNCYGVVNRSTISASNANIRVWNNREGGIDLLGTRTTVVANCTFVGNSNFCIRAQQSIQDVFENNIFVVSDSNSTALAGDAGVIDNAFIDYNIYFFEQASAIYGAYSDLQTWQLSKGHDYRSAITNPLLADVSAGDFHEQSTAGRYLDSMTNWVMDGSNSWAIDRGDPNYTNSLEPTPNGERINIGAYGNTEYASKGSTNSLVYVRTLNDATFIGETNSIWPLIWTVQNVPRPWLVTVQFSGDDGTNWVNIATGVYAFAEHIIWQTTPYYNTYKGRWRVVSESDPSYWDMSDARFTIFYGDFELDYQFRKDELNRIIWRGAWDENYQVQYSTNFIRSTNQYDWVNAADGTGVYQKASFRTTSGGDFYYDDPQGTNPRYRVYRVLWR